jgi:hypothetical protein
VSTKLVMPQRATNGAGTAVPHTIGSPAHEPEPVIERKSA